MLTGEKGCFKLCTNFAFRVKKFTSLVSYSWAICNKFLRTHLCRSQFLEHSPHCRSEEPLKSVASKGCQLVDRCANDRAFYRDAWWKFHCSRLKNPVLPRPPAEKCIHCLKIRDTSQFYALQPRWRWFPGCREPWFRRVGGSRSKERDRKSELVIRSTYQIFEWDRNNSDRNFYNVVRYAHIPLLPWMQERSEAEQRAIWPCLNVATWRRELSDRALQRIR